MIGGRIGRWLVTDELGEGGHAFVYEARDGDRRAALKVPKPSLLESHSVRQRFIDECTLHATLEHEAIVRCEGIEETREGPVMVMELVTGGSLADRLEATGPIPWREALEITRALLEGLIHAHARGVIHRDLKPQNVLLTPEGQPKIADFGVASLTEADTEGLGTLPYMSPERLEGQPASRRSDLYGLGATLFELLTGRVAFPEGLTSQSRIVLEEVPAARWYPLPPSALAPVPREVDELVLRALAVEPRGRYRNAVTMLREVEAILHSDLRPKHVEAPQELPGGARELALSLLTASTLSLAIAILVPTHPLEAFGLALLPPMGAFAWLHARSRWGARHGDVPGEAAFGAALDPVLDPALNPVLKPRAELSPEGR